MATIEILDAKCIASSLRTIHASARGFREADFGGYLERLAPWLKNCSEWYVELAGIRVG